MSWLTDWLHSETDADRMRTIANHAESLQTRKLEGLLLTLDEKSLSYIAGVASRIRSGTPPDKPLVVRREQPSTKVLEMRRSKKGER